MLQLGKLFTIILLLLIAVSTTTKIFAEEATPGTEFTIIPKQYTFLPQIIYPNTTIVAYYTVINNTHIPLTGKFILPPNVILNPNPIYTNKWGPKTCALGGVNEFSLEEQGSIRDSCTLELIVKGPVKNGDVKACLPGGQSCSGTPNPLNVALSKTPNYGVWGYAYNTNQATLRWQSNPFIGQMSIWNPVNSIPVKRFRCFLNGSAADHPGGNCEINGGGATQVPGVPLFNSSTNTYKTYVKNWWLGGGQAGESFGKFVFQLGFDITDKTIQALQMECDFSSGIVTNDLNRSRITSIIVNKAGALPLVSFPGASTSTSALPIKGPHISGTNPIIQNIDTNSQKITAIIPYFPTSKATDNINVYVIANDASGFYNTFANSVNGSGDADKLTCTFTAIRPTL